MFNNLSDKLMTKKQFTAFRYNKYSEVVWSLPIQIFIKT